MRKLDTLFTHRRGAAFKESKLTTIARKSLGRLEQIRKPTKQTFGAYKQTLADGSRVKSYTFGSKYGTLDLVRMYRPPVLSLSLCEVNDSILDAADPAQVEITFFGRVPGLPAWLEAWGDMNTDDPFETASRFRKRDWGSYETETNYSAEFDIATYEIDCNSPGVEIDRTKYRYDWGFWAQTGGTGAFVPVPGTNLMWSEHCLNNPDETEYYGCTPRDENDIPIGPGINRCLATIPDIGGSTTFSPFATWNIPSAGFYETTMSYYQTASGYNLQNVPLRENSGDPDLITGNVIWTQTKFWTESSEGHDQVFWLEGCDHSGTIVGEKREVRSNLFWEETYGHITNGQRDVRCLKAGGLCKDVHDDTLIATRADSWYVPDTTVAYTADLIDPKTGAILNNGSQPRYLVDAAKAADIVSGVMVSGNLILSHDSDKTLSIYPQPSTWRAGKEAENPVLSWSSSEILSPGRIIDLTAFMANPLGYIPWGTLSLFPQKRIGVIAGVSSGDIFAYEILVFNFRDLLSVSP